MKPTTADACLRSAPWLILATLAIVTLAMRLQLSFDLSAFFPRHTTLAHDVLLEQLRNGPGSRLVVIGIRGAPLEQLKETSDQLREALVANPLFTTVQNGQFSHSNDDVPEPIDSYYLLMKDVDYSRASLNDALEARLQDLAFGGGGTLLDLIARDPFLITLDVLEQLAPIEMSGDLWMAEDGTAVLMATTRAPAIDLVAQADAVAAVQVAFAELASAHTLELDITGVGAFGVELQETIRAEAQKLSILATVALCLVLLLLYRSVKLLLFSTLPMGMGFILGLSVVALCFDTVHGITLAFGFTLLGVAIDYPLHLYSHMRQSGRSAITSIWPTMRLGALSTVVAYLAIALSGSEGLAQLGTFTATGVSVAALVTRFWLPSLLPERMPACRSSGMLQPPGLNYVPALVLLILAAFIWWYTDADRLWDDRLSSLSPVPEQRLQRDIALRAAAGTPDMRHQVVMNNESLESLLVESEAVELRLAQAASDGLVKSWRSVAQLLPSRERQAARRQAIPAVETLRARVNKAVSRSPFHADVFEPFVAAAEKASTLPPLEPAAMSDTPLEPWLDSHLLQLGNQWVSLISVSEPDAPALAGRVASWGGDIELVDLHQSTAALMQSYRRGAISTVSVAAFVIVLLIWLQRRHLAQILWISLTVAIALTATVAIVSAFHGPLTAIHFMAALLVLGLGLDYALFLSRTENAGERRATNQAVLACAASTTFAFGVLATSSIPVLKFIGLTVAIGSATSYALALAGSRWPSRAGIAIAATRVRADAG